LKISNRMETDFLDRSAAEYVDYFGTTQRMGIEIRPKNLIIIKGGNGRVPKLKEDSIE